MPLSRKQKEIKNDGEFRDFKQDCAVMIAVCYMRYQELGYIVTVNGDKILWAYCSFSISMYFLANISIKRIVVTSRTRW